MQISTIAETLQFLREKQSSKPLAGIVLGTGLNSLAEQIDTAITIPFNSIPNFPLSTVEFHKGQLIYGNIQNAPVVVMQGRFHYYEGYSMQQITFPVRVMKELGIEYLLLSNAAGGLNPAFKKGDLVITEDHINLLPDNPLRGLGNKFGNRFVDMSQPYDEALQNKLQLIFEKENIE
ncbi:MAG: purine-nucleoside phosphorylase, partial [Ginsengibacter sp.]